MEISFFSLFFLFTATSLILTDQTLLFLTLRQRYSLESLTCKSGLNLELTLTAVSCGGHFFCREARAQLARWAPWNKRLGLGILRSSLPLFFHLSWDSCCEIWILVFHIVVHNSRVKSNKRQTASCHLTIRIMQRWSHIKWKPLLMNTIFFTCGA